MNEINKITHKGQLRLLQDHPVRSLFVKVAGQGRLKGKKKGGNKWRQGN